MALQVLFQRPTGELGDGLALLGGHGLVVVGAGLAQVPEDYDLEVEECWTAREATVLRLPVLYGPHGGQRREQRVLRRLRAGRARLPVGVGDLLLIRGHVDDVATGVLAALNTRAADGAVINLGEPGTWPVSAWLAQIVDA